MKLVYCANIRMPTEKAHGLQIMQNCEAFAEAGAEVTLLTARRINTPDMNAIRDPWAYYGVRRSFTIERVPCLDLFPVGRWFERVAFPLQALTYTLVLTILLLFRRADVYYSRDVLTLLALSLVKPARALVYEAHQLSKSRLGVRLQSLTARRVGLVVAVTGGLAEQLRRRGAHHMLIAHDGFRIERFADLPDRGTARQALALPADAFLVGYVGQLHTMSMGKGLDTLIDAVAHILDVPITLCLVGGPPDMADSLRQRWVAAGLPDERLVTPGRVEPSRVPLYLRAFDVCTMTFPWTEHFAYYASPLKLFEYMAAGGVILASDLPSIAEVVRDGESALLVPPGNVNAIGAALRRLWADPALRERLGARAQEAVVGYSWAARARHILDCIRRGEATHP